MIDDDSFFEQRTRPTCISTGHLLPSDEYEIQDKILSQRSAARLFMGMVPTLQTVSRVMSYSLAAKRLTTQLERLRESKSCQPPKTEANSFPNPDPTP